ncbi:MAG: histidine phosphatase family protein [Gaiellaceae bacterium]
MTEFLLVRHGETDWNRERRFQGHADEPLNELGREQARDLAHELARERIDAIYSSDLARARETAEIVAERVGVPVVTDPALREIDVGEWQGLTWPEIEQRFPEGTRNWHERGWGWEQGESYEDLDARVVTRLREIAAAHPDERICVVGHGGTIRVVRARADHATVPEHRKALPPVANCEVFRLRADQLD